MAGPGTKYWSGSCKHPAYYTAWKKQGGSVPLLPEAGFGCGWQAFKGPIPEEKVSGNHTSVTVWRGIGVSPHGVGQRIQSADVGPDRFQVGPAEPDPRHRNWPPPLPGIKWRTRLTDCRSLEAGWWDRA